MNLLSIFSFNNESLNIKRELFGGLTNFMVICYIIVVNPLILNANGHGFPLHATITATILIIIIATLIASFVIKLPFVIAPSMGLNVMVAYTLCLNDKLPIPIILGVTFWSCLLFFIVSVTNLRQIIVTAIPECIQIALSVGIGLFLIFIGLKNSSVIVTNTNTLIAMNSVNFNVIMCFLGFILASVLFIRGKIYSMIAPILVITIIGIAIGRIQIPANLVSMPDFSLLFKVNLIGSFKFNLLPSILSLFLIIFFDTTSSVIGLLSQLDHLSHQLRKKYFKRSMITDSISGLYSGIVGTSPTAVFVESSVAIHNGAKTGLASLTTAMLCIPFLFFAPLISMIPNYATSPILILVGLLMAKNLTKIKFKHFEEFIAVILTTFMIPLCSSISAGAVCGIVSYTLLKLFLGKFNEISLGLIIVAIGCSFWFCLI